MLRQVIAGLLLLLHIVSFVFVAKADEQDRYVAIEKTADHAGASEADYYLYSSYISIRLPVALAPAGYGNIYAEKKYSYSCANIFSPPPERPTL